MKKQCKCWEIHLKGFTTVPIVLEQNERGINAGIKTIRSIEISAPCKLTAKQLEISTNIDDDSNKKISKT